MFDIVPNAYTARWLFYTVLHGIFYITELP